MFKRISLTAATATLLLVFLCDTGYCRSKGNLYEAFRKRPVVNVYLNEFTSSSKMDSPDIEGLRERLSEALTERKSINFEVVRSIEDADIIIDCDVEKYYWKSEDPIDMIMGAGAIAMDMIMKDNYAYLEAVFTVRDAADSKELWSKKLKIDLTRRGMSMEESLPLINDKTARFFIRECFSKGGSKKR